MSASKARKRRTRSPHPGVVLIPPDPANRHPHWRARFKDPDTGRSPKTTLDPVARIQPPTRRDWAIRKSRALAKRRVELEGGAHRTTGTSLDKALDKYFEDNPQLRNGTKGIYRRAADKLSAWGAKSGVRSADDLTGPKLVAFRAHLVREPPTFPGQGRKAGGA